MLNPYQASTVTIALRSLERLLFQLEALCTEQQAERLGVLVRLVNPLDAEQRVSVLALCGRARETIRVLAGRFNLECEVEDMTRLALGQLVLMWATLEDAKSPKLIRNGSVDPGLAPLLDPELDELIRLINAMERQLLPRTPRQPRSGDTRC